MMDEEAAVVEALGGVLGAAAVLAEGVKMPVAAGAAQSGGKTDAVGRERDRPARDRGVGGVEAAPVGGKVEGVGRDKRLPRPPRRNRCEPPSQAMFVSFASCCDSDFDGGGLPASVAIRPRGAVRVSTVSTFSCERCKGREGVAVNFFVVRKTPHSASLPVKESLHVCWPNDPHVFPASCKAWCSSVRLKHAASYLV